MSGKSYTKLSVKYIERSRSWDTMVRRAIQETRQIDLQKQYYHVLPIHVGIGHIAVGLFFQVWNTDNYSSPECIG